MSFAATALRMSAGPIVWGLHFAVVYGLTALACARHTPGLVGWIILAATVMAAAACLLVIRGESRRPQTFESWVAVGLAVLALVAVVWEGLPGLFVSPCM